MPTRQDLMSLSSINKDKDLFRVKTAHVSQRHRGASQNLDTVDIVGAQPKKWVKDNVNRPEFLGQNWDIDRTCPRALHIGLNKPEYNLTNSDIEKSKPNYIKFQTTNQIPPSNPLNPVYKLAEVEYIPPTPPKFIRDQINNDDIDGAHPKKAKYYETRNLMDVKDIDGAKAKPNYIRSTQYDSQCQIKFNMKIYFKSFLVYTRNKLIITLRNIIMQYDSFNYADITKNKFTSSRSVNPLQPQYNIRDENGEIVTIGSIPGSSPKRQPIRAQGGYFNGLEILDIPGTAVGSKRLGNFHSRERQHFRETNTILDVAGAQASTLKKGINTKRVNDPLNPTYNVPGHTEMAV